MWWNMCLVSFESWELILQFFYQVDWWNLMKQSVTVGAQLLWSGRYGCNNGRYGCTIVMSYIEINKAVSQWLLTFNLCVSVTWPLTCAFHIPCTHIPEIIDMHRGMCDNIQIGPFQEGFLGTSIMGFITDIHNHKQIYQWNNTKMGKNTTFHIHVKSEPGYSPKYPEHVFSVIGLRLCRHGLDHILRQITNCYDGVAICDCRNLWRFKTQLLR